VKQYVALGLKRDTALSISGLTRHQYYYEPKPGKPGLKPSSTVMQQYEDEQRSVSNELIVQRMQEIQSDADLRCGYRRMSFQLQLEGYQINHKKIYRLMKENDLLLPKAPKQQRNFVKYRRIAPQCPLSHLEMDIKFIWLEARRQHALILSIIDVFTRRILEWHVGISITQHTVKSVFSQVVVNHLQEKDMLTRGVHIEVRNDNDKRFSAQSVQNFFGENYLNQVFTHPYTPEENGHIESFHKTLSQALKDQHFDTLEQLEARLITFYGKYNHHRTHGSICGLTPYLFNQQWEAGNIERIKLDKRKIRFKLLIPRYQLSGNESLREASCSNQGPLDGDSDLLKKQVDGATTIQPSVQRSPAVASC